MKKQCYSCPYGARTCNNLISYSCYDNFYIDSQALMCRKCTTNCKICASGSKCD